MSYVEIADRVGVAGATVRRKLNRFMEDGTIRIVAVADPFTMGYKSPAIIFIKAEANRVLEVSEQLHNLPGVRFVALATGQADLILEGCWANNRELARFVTEDLARVRGIREFSTSLVLRIVKQSYELGLPDGGTPGEIQD